MRQVKVLSAVLFALALAACGGGKPESAQVALGSQAKSGIEESRATFSAGAASTKDGAANAPRYTGRILARLDMPPQSGAKDSGRQTLANASNLAALGVAVQKDIKFPQANAVAQRFADAPSNAAPQAPHIALLSITQPGANPEDVVARLNASGLVAYAEREQYMQLHQSSATKGGSRRNTGGATLFATPNDPEYGNQYHLTRVYAPDAWDTTTGSNTGTAPIVAVLDCGFKLDHPDLVNNWWVNAAPTFGDLNGADFGEGDGDPSPNGCTHGTNVAGVIGAEGNNSIGVAGVMWKTRMMALKIEDANGELPWSASIDAANYIVTQKNAGQNIRVANMSFGGTGFSQAFYDAIKALNAAGVLVVASAGNDGNVVPNYPASFGLPNIISVGASDSNDLPASFSSFGRNTHIFAPGVGLLTTSFDAAGAATYDLSSGTSFSSPLVAGVAGLVANAFPSDTMQQIRQRILSNADAVLALDGKSRIPARVAADYAVGNGGGSYIAPTTWGAEAGGPADQYVAGATQRVRAHIGLVPGAGVSAVIGTSTYVLRDDGLYPDEFAGDGDFSALVKPSGTGVQAFTLLHTSGSVPLSSRPATTSFAVAANYQAQTVTHAWQTPTVSATPFMTAGVDDNQIDVALPFGFSFYGSAPVTTISVSSNGLVCAGAKSCVDFNIQMPTWRRAALPTNAQARTRYGLIAPWWNDWVVSSAPGAGVYAYTTGTAPNRRFVVTWREMAPWNVPVAGDNVSFQMQLLEGSNKIVFAYHDVTTGAAVSATNRPDGGARGSVGVQYFNGKIGTRLGFNTAGALVAGQTIELASGPSFPTELTNATDPDLYMSVEGMRGAYVTTGCVGGTSYCGTTQVNRIQMAAFLSRSMFGHDALADYSSVPPANFPDVTTAPNTNYVSALKLFGVTNGCMGGTMYCPTNLVTREQMALFLQRGIRGSTYVPPAGTGAFSDAPIGHPNGGTFEELRRMGITNGCSGGAAFCPATVINRNQMAQFLQRGFMPWSY
jgi:subtilisin family serine protease